MTHRQRRHYTREWSPLWGHRRTPCTCQRDDPDEFVWLFVGSVFGLAAAVLYVAAAIIRRPLLAAAVAFMAVAAAAAAVLWGWPS